jgi:hypothetical protein
MTSFDHPAWDTLNDLADGTLPAPRRIEVERHIAGCADCSDSLARIRALLARASALPAHVAPPAHAWSGIADRIDAEKVVAMPHVPAARAPRFRRSAMLAVAALTLIVGSSGITALVMRNRAPVVTLPVAPAVRLAPLPAAFENVERTYLETVEELATALNAAKSRLSPRTIETVRRNLEIIDAAILEARQALLDDPASTVLREMLARSYEQKIDLLRRATVLDT